MEPDKLERMCVDFKKAEKIESDDFQAMAFYSMMEDASHVGDPLVFNAKHVFRPHEKHPMIDIIDADKELVTKLLYG